MVELLGKQKINNILKNEELWDGGTVRKAKNQWYIKK